MKFDTVAEALGSFDFVIYVHKFSSDKNLLHKIMILQYYSTTDGYIIILQYYRLVYEYEYCELNFITALLILG